MSPSRIPVIGFVAPSGSGKTTLIEKLVPLLKKRGLRVGYLKHAHHRFDLDVPGKDSYQVREAGANQTLLASSQRWALQVENRNRGQDPDLGAMLAKLEADRLDLILVEGFKHAAYPKIEVYRTVIGKPPLYPDDPDVVAVATDRSLPGEQHPPELPVEDPDAIADFILRHVENRGEAPGDLGAELVRYYRWLRRYGCNDSHSGNGSVRDGDGFWVTPTGACADTLGPEDLIYCSLEGTCPEGASLDAHLHQLVYRMQPKAACLLHSHGPYSVAMSFAGQDFRPVDFEGRSYLESVSVLSIAYEDYVDKAPAAVSEALARDPIAMVRGHGVYAWGETLGLAYKWTCSLELSAKTFVIARQAADL